MVDAEVASACSGKHRSERGGERDLRRSEVEDGDRAVLRCVPACLTWRRGRGRCGGAPGLVGEARGRRWTRQRRAAATVAFGRARGRETEGRRSTGRVREGQRGCVAPLASSRRSAASRRWRATGTRASGTRSASDWREVEDDWHLPGGLGRLEELGQVSGPGRFPFSLFFYLFLFSNIL